jgi:Domain of unknown function (DUF4349)/Putative zinc-finger
MNRTMHEIEPEEVMAYLDGELESSRASEVAAHIADCAECRAVEAGLRTVSSRLVNWQETQAPASITEAVERAIESIKSGEKSSRPAIRIPGASRWFQRRPWRIAAAFAATAAVVIVAATVLFQRTLGYRKWLDGDVAYITSSDKASKEFGRLQLYSKLSPAPPVTGAKSESRTRGSAPAGTAGGNVDSDGEAQPASVTMYKSGDAGPMIARTAAMNIVVKKFDDARAALEKLLARHRGFASAMSVDRSEAAPSLDATLQVPAADLDAVLGELRALGHVATESQGGEDVSDQHIDLVARLHNARETEQRLLEILRTRTGRVRDVLEVEEQVSSNREQIEQMEAQLANLDKRVSYASIKLQMGEDYKAPAENRGVALRLRNAIVGGYRDAVDSLLALAVFLLSAGPMLLLWAGLLFFPARAIWKRRGALRAAFSKNAA